jgi:hypothetical protein
MQPTGCSQPRQGVQPTASSVRCAAVVYATSSSKVGRIQRRSLGQRLTSTRKGEGTRACRQSRERREDAETVARRDPRDTAKAALPEVQCRSVNGGPLATASKSQVDSSPRQADGLSDLCESSTAPCGRGRHEWTAYLTLSRVAGVNCGMAYRTRVPWSRSHRSSRRWGELITGRRVAGGRLLKGKGCERHTDLPRVDVVHWKAA